MHTGKLCSVHTGNVVCIQAISVHTGNVVCIQAISVQVHSDMKVA